MKDTSFSSAFSFLAIFSIVFIIDILFFFLRYEETAEENF